MDKISLLSELDFCETHVDPIQQKRVIEVTTTNFNILIEHYNQLVGIVKELVKCNK